MSTHLLRAGLSATLLLISTSLWADDTPKDTAQKTDHAQTKKQCADMKKMDMSKMTAAEHDAMMKKCKGMMQKEKKPAGSD